MNIFFTLSFSLLLSFISSVEAKDNTSLSNQQLRQLFIVSDPSSVTQDKEYGGVILFKDYFIQMTNACLFKKQFPHVSVFTDQEGGNIVRLNDNPPPSAKIARTMKKEDFIRQVKLSAQSLKKACVDVNLAPMVEMNLKDDRSYGEDKDDVIKIASWFAKAMNQEGIATINKHFPFGGYGCQPLKNLNHLGLSLKKNSEAYTCHVNPHDSFYQDAHVFIDVPSDGIMVSQGIYQEFSPWPSLLEPKVGEWLRNQLHYQGIIISDSLWEIEASPTTIIRALQTVDWVMVGYTSSVEEALPFIQQALKKGILKKDDLLLKIKKIEAFKKKYYFNKDKAL